MPWYWLNGLFHNPLRYPWYLSGKNTVFLLSVCVSSHISILSHQLPDNSCCSASPVALILNDLIKFQDVGDNNPRHPHKNPSVGFQFHAMRKRQPRVQSSCEESMRIFPGRRQSVSATMMQDAWMPPLFLIFFPPPRPQSVSPVEHLMQAFIFSLHVSAFKNHTNLPFIWLIYLFL